MTGHTDKFVPSREQWQLLGESISDVVSLGDYTRWGKVPCKPCPSALRLQRHAFEEQQCYQNTFMCLEQLHDKGVKDARYVLGVMDGYPWPVAHAWLKWDGEYYDPTLELAADRPIECVNASLHIPVAELTFAQVLDIIIAGEYETYPTLPHVAKTALLLPVKNETRTPRCHNTRKP